LKLHRALKKRGLNPENVEWFADAIETGVIKLSELQNEYQIIKNEVEVINHKKRNVKTCIRHKSRSYIELSPNYLQPTIRKGMR
jgi:hypothetical protein